MGEGIGVVAIGNRVPLVTRQEVEVSKQQYSSPEFGGSVPGHDQVQDNP